MTASHTIFDGRIHVYKRDDSRYWQCSAFIHEKNFRVSTREESLAKAKDFAEDWYLELRGKHKRGELVEEKTFNEAADQFMKEYPVITEGNRNKVYVKGHEIRLDVQRVGNTSTGFVDAALIESLIPARDADYFFCGPKPFMVSIYHELLTWGIPASQVHFEFFGPKQELERKSA